VEKREPNRLLADLNETVRDAIGLGLIGAAAENINLSVVMAPDLPHISIDKVQIQQVMINLLRNAAEAMGNSSRRKLSVATARESHEFLVVSVSDTGTGLSENVRKRLFEPFVTTKDTGLGIGLSICRTIVEAHGGRLWAEANSGGGSIFRFRLPVLDKADHKDA
jgi:two-component system sensor kinase FixL